LVCLPFTSVWLSTSLYDTNRHKSKVQHIEPIKLLSHCQLRIASLHNHLLQQLQTNRSTIIQTYQLVS
jgi:hypothetical protein